MRRTVLAWVGFWIGFGLLDYWADRREQSLCHAIRYTFKTETPAGRAALTGFLGIGAIALRKHLLKR